MVIQQPHFMELIEHLPGGVIILDSERKIEYLNEEMRKILGKNSERIIGKTFKDFFKKIPGNMFEYETNDDRKISLRGKLQKRENMWLGFFFDVSDLDRYKDLFDGVPAGVYKVDANNDIIMANDGFAKIFGYDSAKEVIGRNVREFYQLEEDMEKFIQTLKETGSIMNYELDMKRKNGRKIIISASSSLVEDENEDQIKREGTIIDITEKIEYLRALEEMPTGYYKVEYKSSKEEITDCNRAFAELFGYSREEIIGMYISDLYADPEEEEKFLRQLRAENEENRDLKDYELRVRRKDGSEFYIEIDCHLIKSTSDKEMGRRGTVRDITHKIMLKKTLRDMDEFVHQYITPLINIEISTEALVALLELITGFKYEKVQRLTPSERIADNYSEMVEDTIPLLKKINIPYEIMEDIESHLADLKERKEIFSDNSSFIDLWTREHICYILDRIHDVSKGDLPENIKNRIRKIEERGRYILQIYALRQQGRIFSTAKLTHNVIESMRFYLFKGEEREFQFRVKDICSIIRKNMELLYPYAQQKGLNFVYEGVRTAKAPIAEEHFDRVISNLILNAVKYSYTREGGFIKIVVEDNNDEVKMEISNYGVPIRKDETNKVFEYGYRGVLSPDWNRMGSGIGLADAKSVVEKHNGKIYIESVPSQPGYSGKYDIPYITTVWINIPKERGR